VFWVAMSVTAEAECTGFGPSLIDVSPGYS
jgi:hypothetical protein